ncbi:MAG: DinB family protein [Dehalococcoidia bacterium]
MSSILPVYLNELRRHLEALRDLMPALPLDARWGDGGATAGQIGYHTSEAADFWLRNVILGEQRPRDRDAEFAATLTLHEVMMSIAPALEACSVVARRATALAAPVHPPPTMTEGRPWTALDALLHITAHTAEHVGELTVVATKLNR